MELDEGVHSGFLYLPANGKLLKKSKQQKFCVLHPKNNFGIERLEIFESNETIKEKPKIITLENVIKLDTAYSDTAFSIITKTRDYEIESVGKTERDQWISAIQSVVFPEGDVSSIIIEEDNELYCSSGGENVYLVKVHKTDASVRCDLYKVNNPSYQLLITNDALQLKHINNKLLYEWPYIYIRRYGLVNRKTFSFEAGRKCKSGEGTFYLENPNVAEIFRNVSITMKSKKRDSASTSSLLENDTQLHVASTMEARSRSPLILPPLTPSNHSVSDTTPQREKILKKQPPKPLRKNPPPPSPLSLNSPVDYASDYELIDNYDKVKSINDAWKTLGVDDVTHSETNISTKQDEPLYSSWGNIKPNIATSERVKVVASPVIQQKKPAHLNYDSLNFFGSTNEIQASYNQVLPCRSPPTPSRQPPLCNNYEEVQAGLEGVRLADDSYLGYAQVRKNSKTGKLSNVPHQTQNDQIDYDYYLPNEAKDEIYNGYSCPKKPNDDDEIYYSPPNDAHKDEIYYSPPNDAHKDEIYNYSLPSDARKDEIYSNYSLPDEVHSDAEYSNITNVPLPDEVHNDAKYSNFTNVPHEVHNNEQYAVISKTKQV